MGLALVHFQKYWLLIDGTYHLDLGCTTGCLERVVSVHNSMYITLVPRKSLMHHDIQKIKTRDNTYFTFDAQPNTL